MINKYQEGGQLTNTQQQGLQYLAQLYMQQTGKDPQQDQQGFMQFVQQLAQQAGVQDIGQLLDLVYQRATQQAQSAKRGAKLNYLRSLTGICPPGTELTYYKTGGRVCAKCGAKVSKKQEGGESPFKPLLRSGKLDKFITRGTRGANPTQMPNPVQMPNPIKRDSSVRMPQPSLNNNSIPMPNGEKFGQRIIPKKFQQSIKPVESQQEGGWKNWANFGLGLVGAGAGAAIRGARALRGANTAAKALKATRTAKNAFDDARFYGKMAGQAAGIGMMQRGVIGK